MSGMGVLVAGVGRKPKSGQAGSFLCRPPVMASSRLSDTGTKDILPVFNWPDPSERAMSVIDKIAAAVTPLPSAEKRAEATAEARAAATPGDWLSLVLDHHDLIRAAFAQGRSAKSAADRTAAFKALAVVLNGHSLAEEVVLYPALGQADHKANAAQAYLEQTVAKNQMAELERIPPSQAAWLDKWEHIEGAVLTHMYEEESGWFLKLRDEVSDSKRLTARYVEEYERYVG
jgi:hypothetical protein